MVLLDIGARLFVVAGLLWLLYVAASIAWQWRIGRDVESPTVRAVESLELERAA